MKIPAAAGFFVSLEKSKSCRFLEKRQMGGGLVLYGSMVK
jgi:hypothetical protein